MIRAVLWKCLKKKLSSHFFSVFTFSQENFCFSLFQYFILYLFIYLYTKTFYILIFSSFFLLFDQLYFYILRFSLSLSNFFSLLCLLRSPLRRRRRDQHSSPGFLFLRLRTPSSHPLKQTVSTGSRRTGLFFLLLLLVQVAA